MSDYSRKVTDKAIERLSKDIRREYSKAAKEVQEKLTDYFKRFEKKDATWKRWVAEGKKTKEQYKAWRTQQMLVGKRWKQLKDELSSVIYKSDKIAYDYIHKGRSEAFAFNANYTRYQIEKEVGIDLGFTQYSPDAVLRTMTQKSDFLPPPGKKLSEKIREGKIKRWHRKSVQSIATQAIMQGESIPNIVKRMSKSLQYTSERAAFRDARTLIGAAENAGRYDSYENARELGLEMEDYWSAVHDSRTRNSHRHMDGEKRGEDGYFSNGLEYPCDPAGEASEVYNCRCRLDSAIKGFSPDFEKRFDRHDKEERIQDMSWEEWKDAKPISSDILSQKNKNNYYKWQYVKEYREL